MVNWSWELNLHGRLTNHLTTTPTLLTCYCWKVKWPRDRSIQLHFSMAKIWALIPTNIYVAATALLLIKGGGEHFITERRWECTQTIAKLKLKKKENEMQTRECTHNHQSQKGSAPTRSQRQDHTMMVALRFDPRLTETLPTQPSSDTCTSGCLTERAHCCKHRRIVAGGGDERFTAGEGGLSHDGHGCGRSCGQIGILPTPHLGDRLDLRVELDALLTQRGVGAAWMSCELKAVVTLHIF